MLGELGGISSMVFGLYMVSANLFDVSPIDELLKAGLYTGTTLMGQDAEFVRDEDFSFFQFTSNQWANLILTAITFEAVAMACSGFSESIGIARRMAAGVSRGEEYLTRLGQFSHRITDILRLDTHRLLIKQARWVSVASIREILTHLIKEDRILELAGRALYSKIKSVAILSGFFIGTSIASSQLGLFWGNFISVGVILSGVTARLNAIRYLAKADKTEYLMSQAIHGFTPVSITLNRLYSILKGESVDAVAMEIALLDAVFTYTSHKAMETLYLDMSDLPHYYPMLVG